MKKAPSFVLRQRLLTKVVLSSLVLGVPSLWAQAQPAAVNPFTDLLNKQAAPPPSSTTPPASASPPAGKPARAPAATVPAPAPATVPTAVQATPAATPSAAATSGAQLSSTPNPGVTLKFDNADIYDVIQVILGDVLKLDYVIDPTVQGRMTLKSTGAISMADIYSALETALTAVRLAGASKAVSLSSIRHEN